MKSLLLPILELRCQRPIRESIKKHVLELHDNYIRWIVDMEAEEMQEDSEGNELKYLPWIRRRVFIDETYLGFYLVGVAMAQLKDTKLWQVQVGIRGSDSLKFHFKLEDNCIEFYNSLREYIVNSKKTIL